MNKNTMKIKTDDLKIESIKAVTSPAVICEEILITEAAAKTTAETRMQSMTFCMAMISA